jgi:hypothetical protein
LSRAPRFLSMARDRDHDNGPDRVYDLLTS